MQCIESRHRLSGRRSAKATNMASDEAVRRAAAERRATWIELFTPKLVTVLREGYGLPQFRSDAVAGLTVAIVALPLSMAIAIAAGATPAQGLYTAIIGGLVVSLLGGSRFQIGGPAGAFIALMAATALMHGMDGLILATIMSGVLLAAIGALQLGTYIKFVPYPVTVGFTAGIAVIIFASQISPLLGISGAGPEPFELWEKLPFLWQHAGLFTPAAIGISALTIGVILGVKRMRPLWPAMLIAITLAAALSYVFDLPIATIGSQFGGIPRSMALPTVPAFSFDLAYAVLPNAIAFALLGSIESLLSATVADGMTGRRHRSNCELVAQGTANVASGMFGGICVTGTIARTATNIRAGAHGPVAGIMHSAFLLLFILVAAPLASYIPLASLAGVLAVVAWDMVEKHSFVTLLRASRGDAAVLLATFLLTVFRSLTEAIVVGVALGAILFINRMSKTAVIEAQGPLVREDRADSQNGDRQPYDESDATDRNIIVFRISGAFFFGASTAIGSVLNRISEHHLVLILDFAQVPFVDSTAAHLIHQLARQARGRGIKVILSGASKEIQKELAAHELAPPLASFAATVEAALEEARAFAAAK